jgi:hypothetical protein
MIHAAVAQQTAENAEMVCYLALDLTGFAQSADGQLNIVSLRHYVSQNQADSNINGLRYITRDTSSIFSNRF